MISLACPRKGLTLAQDECPATCSRPRREPCGLEYGVQGTGEPLVLIHGSILAADELEQRRGLTSERDEMRQRGLVRRDICLANGREYATVENPRAYKQ